MTITWWPITIILHITAKFNEPYYYYITITPNTQITLLLLLLRNTITPPLVGGVVWCLWCGV